MVHSFFHAKLISNIIFFIEFRLFNINKLSEGKLDLKFYINTLGRYFNLIIYSYNLNGLYMVYVAIFY